MKTNNSGSLSSSRCHAVSFHNTACFTYTPAQTHSNTHTHAATHTHTHTPAHSQTHSGLLLFTALQLTASLGVVVLSSWLARIKQDAIFAQPPPCLPFAFPLRPRKPQRSPGKAPPTPAVIRPTGALLHGFPPSSSTPGSPRGLGPTVGALWPACSPVEPRLAVWSSAVFFPRALQQEKPFMATHNVKRGPI